MPRVAIILDGDRIWGEIIKSKRYNPEARLFAAGLMDVPDVKAVKAVARDLFSTTFEIAFDVLTTELGYSRDEFEKVTGFVGEFDENRLPFNIDIVANERPVWYDNPEAMSSFDRQVREAKKNRIARTIADRVHDYVLKSYKVEWTVNCWPQFSLGVYYQTPTSI